MTSKLHLEDCCEDSPQTRALIKVFEEDSVTLSNYANGLSAALQRITEAQNELNSATQALAQHVRNFEYTDFSLKDDDDFIKSALQQMASSIDQVASFNTILYTQLTENSLYHIARFVAKDLAEFSNLKSKFKADDKIHFEATKKLLRLSKKKLHSNEPAWQEATDHLHAARQGFHTTSMAYCSQLNRLQEKKKVGLLKPLIGYVQSEMAFFNMGNEICQENLEEFLNKLSQSTADIENSIADTVKQEQELQDKLDADSTRYYIPDPPPNMDFPNLPIEKNLTQITGYLFVRSRAAFLSQWNQQYFFTQGGNLMQQGKQEVAGGLVIDLDGCMVAHADVDDRRHVFQVTSKDGKQTIYLQAESKYYADLWIATLENISCGKHLGSESSQSPQTTEVPTPIAQTPITPKETPAPAPTPTSFEAKHEAFRPSAMFERLKSAATSLITPNPKSENEAQHKPKATLSTSSDTDQTQDTSSRLQSVVSDGPPILFDLPSPVDPPKESNNEDEETQELESPRQRSNPFSNDKMETISLENESESSQGSSYRAMYVIRFIGCQEVTVDTNGAHGIISDTIRKVMAARALHNIFSMNELHLVVNNNSISLVDPATQLKREVFNVSDIIQASNHRENTRLFGFIARNADKETYMCYAFESNSDGADICCAIATAQVMVQSELEYEEAQKHKNVEMELEKQSKLIAHMGDPVEDASGAGDSVKTEDKIPDEKKEAEA